MSDIDTGNGAGGDSFYALVSGPVPSPFPQRHAEYLPLGEVVLRVVDLGTVRVPSGRVEACDPFGDLGGGPVFDVEPGDYPVRVTIADVSKEQDGSHEREAYLSLVLGDGEPVAVEEAQVASGPDWGVGVDSGTVAFVDHEAVPAAMPAEEDGADWYSDIFDSGEPGSWFSLMDSSEHYREGAANIVMPLATHGENVVMSHSGFGDGSYPVYLTRDAAGRPLGLHIDLLLIAPEEDEDDAEDAG